MFLRNKRRVQLAKFVRSSYAQAARVINSIHDEVHSSNSDDHCIISSEFSGKSFLRVRDPNSWRKFPKSTPPDARAIHPPRITIFINSKFEYEVCSVCKVGFTPFLSPSIVSFCRYKKQLKTAELLSICGQHWPVLLCESRCQCFGKTQHSEV